METQEQNIARLIAEAVEYLNIDGVYDLALRFVDAPKMAQAQGLTAEEIAKNFSVAGFAAGIKFALENFVPEQEEQEP